ncbi:MAG: hypothetical protein ACO3JF_00500 [Ilumatobacteraceae bacterium]
MSFLFSALIRRLLKLNKARHPWVRRLAIITAVIGWISRRTSARSQVVKLGKGETLQVSVVTRRSRKL